MGLAYTKADLIRELALAARISRRRVEAVLDALTQAAYREAKQGFAVPGICRLDVVHRKARQIRNPQTGEILLVSEHDALRVRPVKRARDMVAPTPRALVQRIPPATPPASDGAVATAPAEAGPTPASAPAAAETLEQPTPSSPVEAAPAPTAPTVAVSAETAPAPAVAAATAPASSPAVPETETEFLSFRCKACGQEIEAPLDMAGNPSECPSCGASLIVPYLSEPGTIWDRGAPTASEQPPPDPKALEAMKGRTIRIELSDDI